MSTNIEGKIVVITGASSGLGEATGPISLRVGREPCAGCTARDKRLL